MSSKPEPKPSKNQPLALVIYAAAHSSDQDGMLKIVSGSLDYWEYEINEAIALGALNNDYSLSAVGADVAAGNGWL